MPEKVLFKTGRIHGFSNRNAADDAEAVWRSHKKKSAKNYSLDRQTTSSQIGEITGVKRNCFLKNLRIVCRFFRMSFFCTCLGISPQRCSACPHRGGRGRIISHSDGHSIVRSALCPPTNQLGIFLLFERSKFCKLSANDKKSRYTPHQISGRKSLAISLMKLCTGSEIQKPSVSAFSAPQADTALERRSRNLFRRLPCVSLRYSVVAL